MTTTKFLMVFEVNTKITIERNNGIEYEGDVAHIPFALIKKTDTKNSRIGINGDLIITIA